MAGGVYTLQAQGRPVSILDEGVTISSNVGSINFTGAGVTGTNIGDDVTENISGALSSLILPITSGTINDSNTVFGFAQLPSAISVNGGIYQQTGGAITWTWNSGTLQATLSFAVGQNGSIFGLL